MCNCFRYSMTNVYFKFYDFWSKGFGATYTSVRRPFPGPRYCCPSPTQAVTSQTGHIKLVY